MSSLVDFSFTRQTDGTLVVPLNPPTAIGGWPIEFNFLNRFGGEPRFTKSCNSGFVNVSGINVVNSGQGIFSVTLNRQDTSGIDYGAYAYQISRLTSGQVDVLTEGFATITP